MWTRQADGTASTMEDSKTSRDGPTAAMMPGSPASPALHLSVTEPSSPVDEAAYLLQTQGLRQRLSMLRKSNEEITQLRKHGRRATLVANFYEQQNTQIDTFLEPIDDDNAEEEAEAMERQDKKVTVAIQSSLLANLLLFCLQSAAALKSGSLALFATAIDSFMDLLSGVILMLADRSVRKHNLLAYPTGKRRFETIGVIVFACLMSTVSLQLMIEGSRALLSSTQEKPKVQTQEIIFVSIALVYCAALARLGSSSAKTLAQDHSNDLIVNTFGLAMSLLGDHIVWWADPCGALLIALVILRSWTSTAWENVQLIVGRTAPPSFLNRITYMAATHHPAVRQVDTCKAYYLGSNLFVEVDIVLPPDMCLKDTHDIGESLQIKLESLKNVERAFVHCDYEYDHRPEHKIM